ncbi:XRE family transcriptional regulator [Streptomyces lasiicapitis]|uniref:XRE family transcriptional regulator n=1 Tax=Streptomyces lasiicapitis TaxID=1923961 RepID=UPI0036489284
MKTDEPPTSETFAQALAELKNEYDVNDSEVARRLNAHGLTVSVSAVNTWANAKRTPRPDAIRALAAAFPKYTEERLFAAAGRKAPGPVSREAEERLLELFKGLTKAQQEFTETQMRALNESNQL